MELRSLRKPATVRCPFLSMAAACLLLVLPVHLAAAPQTDRDTYPRNWLVEKLPAEEIARLEQGLEQNPEDIATRVRLLYAYVANANNERRASHLLWLIEHHPETPRLMTTQFVFAGDGPLQDVASYRRAAELWHRQAESRPTDRQVIINAAYFLRQYYFLVDPFQAERWTLRGQDVDPGNPIWRGQLAMDYAFALVNVASGRTTPAARDFATHARAELDRSTDPAFLWKVGDHLLAVARSPITPETIELQNYARRLSEHAGALGFHPPVNPAPAGSRPAGR